MCIIRFDSETQWQDSRTQASGQWKTLYRAIDGLDLSVPFIVGSLYKISMSRNPIGSPKVPPTGQHTNTKTMSMHNTKLRTSSGDHFAYLVLLTCLLSGACQFVLRNRQLRIRQNQQGGGCAIFSPWFWRAILKHVVVSAFLVNGVILGYVPFSAVWAMTLPEKLCKSNIKNQMLGMCMPL